MVIKVCGMCQAGNIREVEALGIDMMGFIFYPKSPRYNTEIPDYLPQQVKRVGVFVNETEKTILERVAEYQLDYVQLHGKESPEYCLLLKEKGIRLLKAFSIETPDDLSGISAYEGICDYYVFDTKTPGYGGSGQQFDWNILTSYQGNTPFLLSGGIHPESSEEIKSFQHPLLAGYDLNSRFEISPALKDLSLIARFLNSVK
ncbi:MAG: phosphoribosylanthranilate isomerase [Bacteroides sp.]|nr:phosphoribosylanthranilate isomerase [Bacteroides sp.]